jgi:hypothetical protein
VLIVLVYKPVSGTEQVHAEYPFQDIEVFGLYPEDENEAVLAMVKGLMDQNPNWQFAVGSAPDNYTNFTNWGRRKW